MSYLSNYFNQVSEKDRDSAAISILAALDVISKEHPLIADEIVGELKSQRSNLKLIASENYSSLAVQLTMGNWLTDKYSEGFAFHRFYAGCEHVDRIEQSATDELKNIFNVDHAYVQPHSGADANLIAFWAILTQRVESKELEKIGKKNINQLSLEENEQIRQVLCNQKVMGMALNSGGHLTHGYRMNVSGKMMRAVTYDVDPKTLLIDYKALAEQVKKEKPLILIAGYSAYPRRLNFAKLKEIADSVGAVLMVDMAHFAGLVAGKVFTGEEDPTSYADMITSTTHKTLRGPRGGLILCTKEFESVVNKGCPLVMGGPLPHVMAAKAVAFKEANTSNFQSYAKQIVNNAKTLAEELMANGVKLLTDGTDNHLIVANVFDSFGLTGLQAEKALVKCGITLNRNSIPFDTKSPWLASGIRLGTPALTSLGMKENEMRIVGRLISKVLKATRPKDGEKKGSLIDYDSKVFTQVREEVKELLSHFPLYPELMLD